MLGATSVARFFFFFSFFFDAIGLKFIIETHFKSNVAKSRTLGAKLKLMSNLKVFLVFLFKIESSYSINTRVDLAQLPYQNSRTEILVHQHLLLLSY